MGVRVEDVGGFLGAVVLLADELVSPWRAASIRAGNLRLHEEQMALARLTRHETIPMLPIRRLITESVPSVSFSSSEKLQSGYVPH